MLCLPPTGVKSLFVASAGGKYYGLELLALHPAEVSRDSSSWQCQEPSELPESQHYPGRGSWGGCGSSGD